MKNQAGHFRGVLAGLTCGLIGFSYAIATSNRSTPESLPVATGRSLSSNLNFANARLPNGNRDLGDAVVGSACFVRTIGVIGGIPPYTFSVTSNSNGLAADNLALVSLPLVGLFGTTTGGVIPNSASPGQLTFGVSAVDSVSSNANTGFTLNILSGQNQFRFALTQLNDALQYRDYQCALPVINGRPPYNFAVVSGSVIAGGKTQPSLQAVGLSLTADGMVVGQPTVAGSVSFSAACTDATGAFARSRDGSVTNQLVTFNVFANVVVSNTVVVTAFSASGDTSTGGKDKASLSAQLNLNGQSVSSLKGPITFRLGNAVIATGTGSKGKFALLKGGGATKAASVKASINANGQLKATFSNQSFGTRNAFGGIQTFNTIPIQVVVGNVVDGMSVISANAKPQKSTKFSMKYKLGTIPKGGTSGTLAGAFIITSVAGKDDTKGGKNSTAGTRDAWRVSFIAVPPSGTSFNNVGTSATIIVGTKFSDTESVSSGKGTVKTGKIDAKSINKITKLQMSDKGKGGYQTGGLDASLTGISLAGSSTKNINYATEIDLGTKYGGTGVMAIFPRKSQWSSKNPSK